MTANTDNTAPKRRGRKVQRTGPQAADAFHLSTQIGRAQGRFLSDGDLELFRAQAMALLQDYGVVVIHPAARAALLKAGAQEGGDADRLRLPSGLVEEALRETPKTARLCGKRAERDVRLPRADGQFVMRTGTGAHGYVDPRDARYRNTDFQAIREMGAVAEGLDQVAFVAHPFVHGVPEMTADIHAFGEMIQRTSKHC